MVIVNCFFPPTNLTHKKIMLLSRHFHQCHISWELCQSSLPLRLAFLRRRFLVWSNITFLCSTKRSKRNYMSYSVHSVLQILAICVVKTLSLSHLWLSLSSLLSLVSRSSGSKQLHPPLPAAWEIPYWSKIVCHNYILYIICRCTHKNVLTGVHPYKNRATS